MVFLYQKQSPGLTVSDQTPHYLFADIVHKVAGYLVVIHNTYPPQKHHHIMVVWMQY